MLFDALEQILVDDGPLDALHLMALPPKQLSAVDVSVVPVSGVGAQRYLGHRDISDGPRGVTHDGGVDWYHSGVQLYFRGWGGLAGVGRKVMEAADSARDMLAQFTGAPVVRGGELVHRVEITNPPYWLESDRDVSGIDKPSRGRDTRRGADQRLQGRIVVVLTIEVWHRPDWHDQGGGTVVPEVPLGPTIPVMPITDTLYVAWSDDAVFDETEVLAGDSSMTGTVVIPARVANGYLGVFVPVSEGNPSAITVDGNPSNQRQGFTAEAALTQLDVAGVAHYALVSNALQNAAILGTGARTLTVGS